MKSDFAPVFKLSRTEHLSVSETKRDELRKRKEGFRQHPASARTWEEVKISARAHWPAFTPEAKNHITKLLGP